jgi:hypothetical protein
MTRTERATSPRAMMKDRSEPRNGMGRDMAKGGAGPHNWGSLINERELEDTAREDEERELEEEGSEYEHSQPMDACSMCCPVSTAPLETETTPAAPRKTSVSMTDEEKAQAAKVRKNALKDGSEYQPMFSFIAIAEYRFRRRPRYHCTHLRCSFPLSRVM